MPAMGWLVSEANIIRALFPMLRGLATIRTVAVQGGGGTEVAEAIYAIVRVMMALGPLHRQAIHTPPD